LKTASENAAADLAGARQTSADRKNTLDTLLASYNEMKQTETELKQKLEAALANAGTTEADAKALDEANVTIKSLADENAKLKTELATAKNGSRPMAVPVRSEADLKALEEANAKIESLTDENAKLKHALEAAKNGGNSDPAAFLSPDEPQLNQTNNE
jgi:DNA repair exonuclease SbcCD ATPase subunit